MSSGILRVVAGAPFEVELAAAPTTGYVWKLASCPAGVQLLGTDLEQSPTAAIGEGGTQVFRLKTEHAGSFDLNFELKRPWESTPIQTRVIEVQAR